jgi:hypothetical protein
MDSIEEEISISESEYHSKYEEIERIGEGSYGCIVRIRDTRTGKMFARKAIPLVSPKSGVPISVFHEMQVGEKPEDERIHFHKRFFLRFFFSCVFFKNC